MSLGRGIMSRARRSLSEALGLLRPGPEAAPAADGLLVAGLGNPGDKYRGSRHNVGFEIIDHLAARLDSRFERDFEGLVARGKLGETNLVLLKPLTYMNRSGRAVVAAAKHFGIAVANLVVIHDEVDLPFGRLKIKNGGGHAGHNGLRSIVASLGSSDFIRLRVGIGRPSEGTLVEHVLAPWSQSERASIATLKNNAADALEEILREGVLAAMNRVNGRQSVPTALGR